MTQRVRRRVLDFALCIVVGTAIVGAYYWAMASGWVNEERIALWGSIGLTTIGLVSFLAPRRKQTSHPQAFWLLLAGLLVFRSLVLGWVLPKHVVKYWQYYVLALPIDIAWMGWVLKRLIPR